MQIKLGRVVDPQFHASLAKLMRVAGLPPKVAFRLRGLKRSVDAEVAKYNEVKDGYIAEYGERDDAGKLKMEKVDGRQAVSLKAECVEECKTKLRDLQSLDVAVEEFTLADLGEKTLEQLTAEDLFWLEFVTEGAPASEA